MVKRGPRMRPHSLALLRARRQRQCGRAAEQRDERAPLHSITSSARRLPSGRRVRRVRIRPPNPFFEDLLRRGRLKVAKTAKSAAEARDAKVRDATSK